MDRHGITAGHDGADEADVADATDGLDLIDLDDVGLEPAGAVVPLATAAGPGQPFAVTRESCFHVWRTAGQRSQRKTAKIVGVPRSTIARWAKDDRWAQRVAVRDAEDLDGVRAWTDQLVHARLPQVFAQAWALIEGDEVPAHVRFDAIKWWAGLAGHVPVQKSAMLVQSAPMAEYTDGELDTLAATPEGVAQLLALSRQRPAD